MTMSRDEFRERCVERDGGECLVPWCSSEVTVDPDGPGEVHHIIERELWPDGGYHPKNGASVCNKHHRMAERNEIPPQALWRWIVENAEIDGTYVPLPESAHQGVTRSETAGVWTGPETANEFAVDKWGEPFESPPHGDLREYHKYPSTRHLLPCYWQSDRGTAGERTARDDTGLRSVESFLDIPLIATIKMDGSNTMLVADEDEPVRARNGSHATHESFDRLKQEYWDRNVYGNLPEHLQVFGENMYAKHSIHYGCPHDGCGGCAERNRAPALDDVFYVFGVYDTRYDLWLSWRETYDVAEQIGFPVAPWASRLIECDDEKELVRRLTCLAEDVVDEGHEGLVVRSRFPFHYGQFSRKVGKYVRPDHVQTDEHWSSGSITRNAVR